MSTAEPVMPRCVIRSSSRRPRPTPIGTGRRISDATTAEPRPRLPAPLLSRRRRRGRSSGGGGDPRVGGRVRLSARTATGALLIPQRAVTELQCSYQVAVVSAENKVSIRPVTVGDRVGKLWIVTDGLKAGERVIIEGLLKVRDGAVVNITAEKSPDAGG